MYDIVASGMIADELPNELMTKFLQAVNRQEGEVFFGRSGVQNQNAQIDRKRAQLEIGG